jgi:hypothetical protein
VPPPRPSGRCSSPPPHFGQGGAAATPNGRTPQPSRTALRTPTELGAVRPTAGSPALLEGRSVFVFPAFSGGEGLADFGAEPDGPSSRRGEGYGDDELHAGQLVVGLGEADHEVAAGAAHDRFVVGGDPHDQFGGGAPVGRLGVPGVGAVGAGVGPACADETGPEHCPAMVAGDGDSGAEGGESGVVSFSLVDVGPFEFGELEVEGSDGVVGGVDRADEVGGFEVGGDFGNGVAHGPYEVGVTVERFDGVGSVGHDVENFGEPAVDSRSILSHTCY